MDKQKLLIVDGAEDMREAMADLFRGSFRVCCCADGYEAKTCLSKFLPDIMILDVMLPGIDGLSLLQWALDQNIVPRVLLTTRLTSAYVLEAAKRLGVGYIMLKPCDLNALVQRVEDLGQSLRQEIPRLRTPENQVSATLLALGFRPNLRGYDCLREAILISCGTKHLSVTKVLYPEVAKRCGCKSAHVERNIRSAIESAWSARNDALWRLYFTPDSRGNVPRPTNAVFISRMADSIRSQSTG